MTSQELTLGGYIKQLAIRMEEQGVMLPFKDDKPWHMLFWRLREEFNAKGSSFLSSMFFDWDGPYPKSRDVSDFLQGLHWTGSVSALNPTYEQIIVPAEVRRKWKDEGANLGAGDEALLKRGLEIAKDEFPSLMAA